MSDPVRRQWSHEELRDASMRYMLQTFGGPSQAADRDDWYRRLGMLVDFVGELWNERGATPQSGDT